MANGVEVRGGSLRVYFRYEGELRREPLDLEPTPANQDYAEQLVGMVQHEIKAGIFNYGQRFPNSKHLKDNTLGHYLNTWLDIKQGRVASSTHLGYAICVQRIRQKFGDSQADAVDYIDIERWISEELGGCRASLSRKPSPSCAKCTRSTRRATATPGTRPAASG
jgi:integrase